MSQGLFVRSTIAVIWDFDKTLSPHYMQDPLFLRYGVKAEVFWNEVNGLKDLYLRAGAGSRGSGVQRVSEDTLYLNHILTYVRSGPFKGLNNQVLRELGAGIEFYPGLPEFFDDSKNFVQSDPRFTKHEITVEHYIVSTGLREMIMGSKIAPFVDDVWGCEFTEVLGQPGYLDGRGRTLFPEEEPTLAGIAYMVDNTSKTRAIFEINKGTNKLADIGVNDTIDPEDRRVPFHNMIYIADGPSDVPSFSIVNQYGGKTFAVYQPQHKGQFKQVARLQSLRRVQGIGEADYTEGSLTSMWILNAIEEIAERIVEGREKLLHEKVGQSPRHIISEKKAQSTPVDAVAMAALESAIAAEPTVNSDQKPPDEREIAKPGPIRATAEELGKRPPLASGE